MGPGGDLHGPQGIEGTRDGCPFGSLVANIGIISGGTFHCLGQQGEMVAERDGILYLGPNDNMLDDNLGTVVASVTSNGRPSAQLACGAIGLQVQHHAQQSSWAELRGWYTILAVPTQQVLAQRHLADVAVATYDAWYASHRDLAGGVPYKGQAIRFVPSPGIGDYGASMFAGNPIRVDPGIGAKFLLVQDPRLEAWGYVHELGHDFNNINGGRYMIGPGPGEAWANVFSLYTLRRFGHPDGQRPHCKEAREYLDEGKPYAELRHDAWISLCLLMELQQRHGWGMYERFFHTYNRLDQTTVPGDDSDDMTRWTWLRDALSQAAGADVTPVLRKYRVPLAN
ncbi:MAG: hypothetical protein JRI68_08125 [Deltaproteobacteria bacterium]|nr:hypothetical protein [Deltaproteobacteria bacterium]